jgi:hypothetical protein
MITCFSMRPFRAQESAPKMARRAPKTVCPDGGVPDGREEEYLANDTAEGLVQRMRAAFPSFDGDVLLHHPLRFLFPKS